jgi:hypothetical protein
MPSTDPLVSIGLPVRNAEHRVAGVVSSVLAQDHPDLELVISDNASTDGTEVVCRELARSDARVVYHRQPENVGLLNNFIATMRLARGAYFRWVGDDDVLAPHCISRCLQAFAEDDGLLLVTTQVAFVNQDGSVETAAYDGTRLRSADPVDRFIEMLRLLNESYLVLDPLSALVRREPVAAIPRRNMLREDQVFAAKMALAGRWGHVPEVLLHRGWKHETRSGLARRLGVPMWHARVATVLQCRELIRCLSDPGLADLTPAQRRRARAAVGQMYLRRQQRTMVHRGRRVAAMAGRLGRTREDATA